MKNKIEHFNFALGLFGTKKMLIRIIKNSTFKKILIIILQFLIVCNFLDMSNIEMTTNTTEDKDKPSTIVASDSSTTLANILEN